MTFLYSLIIILTIFYIRNTILILRSFTSITFLKKKSFFKRKNRYKSYLIPFIFLNNFSSFKENLSLIFNIFLPSR